MQQVLKAAEQIEALGIAAHVFSITSYTELAIEAESCDRTNRLNPLATPQVLQVEQLLGGNSTPVVAACDYAKSLPKQIASWLPQNFTTLGTDGFGLSEARDTLREHFEVSALPIVHAAVLALYKAGDIDRQKLEELSRY